MRTSCNFGTNRYFSKTLLGKRVLVTGANGQVGSHLVKAICKEVGPEGKVLASDVGDQNLEFPCEYTKLDICDEERFRHLVKTHKID
jgi:nucleoside-diphosphate-sugar epimerase